MKRIRKNKDLIYLLSQCPAKFQKSLLKQSDDELIEAILEIILNTLRGNASIDSETKSRLKKYKKALRKLICPYRSLKCKRKVLVQSGGFLSILLPVVINGVLSHIFKKINE